MEIINFENKEIRTLESDGETWYSVIDVISAVTDSANPSVYWRTLRNRLKEEGSQVVTNCNKLKLAATDGRMRETDCATRETLLRLIQSIPSKSVEPFKLWLANAGEQNIQETENPSQLFSKMVETYQAQGRTEDWIMVRIRALAARFQLTDTWKNREVKDKEFALLIEEIHNGTFDMTSNDHKEYKGLTPKDSLEENMSNLELIYTTLSETLTKELTMPLASSKTKT